MATEINSSDIETKVARSAAYPYISIQEAVDFLNQIRKSFSSSWFKRDDISAILNKKAIHREIAAAVHYGLVERDNEKYRLSKRVQEIVNHVSDNERRDALVECFKSPKLYKELIEKYDGHVIPPDQQLRVVLIRFHGITEVAAPQAAGIFIENASYVGVLNENRILNISNSLSAPQDFEENEGFSEPNADPEKPLLIQGSSNTSQEIKKEPKLLEEINGSINLKIHLSEKKLAHLIYPETMNEKDIQILKLQLEAIALTL